MSDFFSKWFDTRSKAQREADAKAYQQKLLPYGLAQREKLLTLFERISSVKQKDLLMYQFLVIKEQLLADESLAIEETLHQAKDPYLRKMTAEDRAFFARLMRIDLTIGEDLDYESKL